MIVCDRCWHVAPDDDPCPCMKPPEIVAAERVLAEEAHRIAMEFADITSRWSQGAI